MGNKSGASAKKSILTVIEHPENQEKVKSVFKGLDKNGDGKLDRAEWKAFANVFFGIEKKSTDSAAIKKSGVEKYFDILFNEADIDGDGVLSFVEFESWLKTKDQQKQDSRSSSARASIHLTVKQYSFVVLLTGLLNVGKTSLAKRFLLNEFSADIDRSADSVNCKTKTFDWEGYSYKLLFKDTCGSEQYNTVTPSLLQRVNLMFVCFDLTSRASWEEVPNKINEGYRFSPHSLTVLVGTKSDLTSERSVSGKEISDFADSRKLAYYETSSKEGNNIDIMFKASSTALKDLIQDPNTSYEEESEISSTED